MKGGGWWRGSWGGSTWSIAGMNLQVRREVHVAAGFPEKCPAPDQRSSSFIFEPGEVSASSWP